MPSLRTAPPARRTRTAWSVVAGGALAVCVVVGWASLPAAASSGLSSARRAPTARPYAVGVRTETFVDRSRPTPADVVAGITPSSSRSLETRFYYPARRGGASTSGVATPTPEAAPADGRFPLVLFSPGAPGTPRDYEALLTDWVGAGYVVVAIQFPVSSLAGPDDVAWTDLPQQSGDVRFVLDRVLTLDRSSSGLGIVDRHRIAVAGHSFGGVTALSLVSACCRDARIDAAMILSGVTDPVYGPSLRGARGPVLFVHARHDPAVAYGPVPRACATARGVRRLLTVNRIRGARAHVTPYLGEGDVFSARVRPATIAFLDGYVRGRASARAGLDRAGSANNIVAVSRCPPGLRGSGGGAQASRVTSRAALSVRSPR